MAFADMMTAVGRRFRSFVRSDRGNMTMIATLSAIPIVGAAGIAIDYARISRVHDEVQQVADGATLFAAGAKTLGGTLADKRATRAKLATNYLKAGLQNVSDATINGAPTVTATDSAITVSVSARVVGTFSNIFDMLNQSAYVGSGSAGHQASMTPRSYNMTISSTAGWKPTLNYICLLALNSSSAQSLQIQGTADIKSKSCSVWVNSSASQALYQNGTATLTAQTISVVGNYYGTNYSPQPSVGVSAFNDPLATKFATDYATEWAAAPTRTAPNGGSTQTIQPGKYPAFSINNGGDVTMAPGVYFFTGNVNIKSGGWLRGTGVTMIFTDATSSSSSTSSTTRMLTVQAGGNLQVKAKSSGTFAGIAIAQHPNALTGTTKTTANNIQGGGTLDFTGILYFPKQILYITGAGNVSTTSPMFAIIADKVFVEGNGQLTIGQAADFDSAGLPALPSSGSIDAKVTLR